MDRPQKSCYNAEDLSQRVRRVAFQTPQIEARDPGLSKDRTMEEELRGVKVLVIDDSKTIRRSAETLLSKAGCDVITAVDGFDALAKIADSHPEIIFVDIMMPRLDGYQTCALIKNNSEFKSTPVVMLSSKDGLFDKAKGRIVGSDRYITKPFSKEELLGTIRNLVS
jgi:twitching motility two-component system response regulator PilG